MKLGFILDPQPPSLKAAGDPTGDKIEKRIADPTVAAVPGRSPEEGTANTEALGWIWPAHPGQEGGQGRRKADSTASGQGGVRHRAERVTTGLGFDSKHPSSPGGFQKQGRDVTQFRSFKGLLAAGWGRRAGARVGAGEPGAGQHSVRGRQVVFGDGGNIGEVESGKGTQTGVSGAVNRPYE